METGGSWDLLAVSLASGSGIKSSVTEQGPQHPSLTSVEDRCMRLPIPASRAQFSALPLVHRAKVTSLLFNFPTAIQKTCQLFEGLVSAHEKTSDPYHSGVIEAKE